MLHNIQRLHTGITVADPGLRWRGQGANLGPGVPKVLFGTYFHTQKVKNWGQGAMAPRCPTGSATGLPSSR